MSDYTVERWGTSSAPWSIVAANGLKVPVLRPYPGPSEVPLPPIEVTNFRTRTEAHAAATEIDWSAVAEVSKLPKIVEAAETYRRKRESDAAYQHALVEARAGREPWPWEPGGLLHRDEEKEP